MRDSETGSAAELPQNPRSKRAKLVKRIELEEREPNTVDTSPNETVLSTAFGHTEGSSAMKTVGSDAPTDLGVKEGTVFVSPTSDDAAKRPVTELRKRQLEEWITQALVSGTRQPK